MRLLQRYLVQCLLTSSVLLFGASAQAASLEERVSSPQYAVRAPSRLFQGIVNVSLGWTTLLTEPYKAAQSKEVSFHDGCFRGLAYPFSYTALGVYDIGTFWFPNLQNFGTTAAGVHKNVLNL